MYIDVNSELIIKDFMLKAAFVLLLLPVGKICNNISFTMACMYVLYHLHTAHNHTGFSTFRLSLYLIV